MLGRFAALISVAGLVLAAGAQGQRITYTVDTHRSGDAVRFMGLGVQVPSKGGFVMAEAHGYDGA
jgi:hypothetical protein